MKEVNKAKPIVRASLYASCSPGGERHLLNEFCLNLDDRHFWTESQHALERNPNYFVLKIGTAEMVFAPETQFRHMCEVAQRALNADLLATFQPQAWINGYAINTDDGRIEFDALPAILKGGREAIRGAFDGSGDLDYLADDLAEFAAHNGPFEVHLDEETVVDMVRLLSSRSPRTPSQSSEFSSVDQMTWNAFALTARGILDEHIRVRAGVAADVVASGNPISGQVQASMIVRGNRFDFLVAPDGVRELHADWIGGAVDDLPTQLAREVIESLLLSYHHISSIEGCELNKAEMEQVLVDTFDRLGPVIARYQAQLPSAVRREGER